MKHEMLIESVSKSFPGVQALQNVNLKLSSGSIHALLGENGAGKSTLIKIITGVYRSDSGRLTKDGEAHFFESPIEATRAGIAVVHQERNLIPDFTVEENITLHNPPMKLGIIDRKKRSRLAKEALTTIGFDIDLDERVKNLSVAQMQLVEIAKALVTKAEIILLDEPTASITHTETIKLFEILNRLRSQGTAILFVSHKLEEVFQICDTVSVLRDGEVVLESEPLANYKQGEIVDLMVGRHLADQKVRIREIEMLSPPELELRKVKTSLGHQSISMTLQRGEILGMYGLVGAGRSELARSILGLHSISEGEIFLRGKSVKITNMEMALNKFHIGYVTENRKEEGLFLDFSVERNISSTVLQRIQKKFGVISAQKERELAIKFIDRLGIRVFDTQQISSTLSGGNQQKVSVAKWLAAETTILIVDEPTVGVDVRTKAAFHELLMELADGGLSIILISSDLPEVIAISDRIIVMNNYEIVGEMVNTKDYPTISRSIMAAIHAA